MKKITLLIQLLTCILILCASALQHNGLLWGSTAEQLFNHNQTEENVPDSVPIYRFDGDTLMVNTTRLAADVKGYAGAVPVEIKLIDRKIVAIDALENRETPGFFEDAVEILDAWKGLTPEEALAKRVDAVSGATFTSKALIENVHRGLIFVHDTPIAVQQKQWWNPFDYLSWSQIAALLVALMGIIIPLFIKNKVWRSMQLLLNVVVLGFWAGTFLSYTSLLSLVENGWQGWTSLLPVILVVTAFCFPLFGKKQHYCTHVCPLGSLQELTGRLNKHKWQLKPTLIQRLQTCRDILWAVLMLLMLTGLSFAWIDYEVFTAFIITSASIVVLVFAVIVLLLSFFVSRPYCRFICPTGTMIKIIEN